ncbi:hypothetical protein BJ742DRAFT_489549 [Cladochytrium replicatum]|nr:hypothetical protein BJ742DRAFT_489549 [Cladochytrium replicatum]
MSVRTDHYSQTCRAVLYDHIFVFSTTLEPVFLVESHSHTVKCIKCIENFPSISQTHQIMTSRKDHVLWRKNFSRKLDGTLDALRNNIWFYRVGAVGFAAYGAWDLYLWIATCNIPVSLSSPATLCETAKVQGRLSAIQIGMALDAVIIAGHLATLILTVMIMRWRQLWINHSKSQSGRTPFHPDAVFASFTSIAFINILFLLLYAVHSYLYRFAYLVYSMGFAILVLIGGAFTGQLVTKMWSLNIRQPAKDSSEVKAQRDHELQRFGQNYNRNEDLPVYTAGNGVPRGSA